METATPIPAHDSPERDDWRLDDSALGQLRALDSPKRPGFLANTLRMFLAQVPGEMAQLEAAVGHADPNAARRSAHTLKSNSALIGAIELSARFERIEALARRGTLDPLRPLIQEARAGYAFVEAHIVELLDAGPNV